jgi:uncharacterized protein (TIGR02147 family)
MDAQRIRIEIVQILKGEIERLNSKYPGYSLRRFSRKLGVPSPVLSQVLNGRRTVTRQLAEKLLMPLPITAEKKHALIHSLPERRSRKSKTSQEPGLILNRIELSFAEFQVVADWWHFAILAFLDSSPSGLKNLAERFGLPVTKIRKAIKNLVQLGLVEQRSGVFHSTGKKFTTSTDIPSAFIRANHIQGLDLARKVITDVPVELRDFSSMTVSCDLDQINEIKKRIETFRRSLSSFMESTRGKSVCRLQIQLFPLTRERNL